MSVTIKAIVEKVWRDLPEKGAGWHLQLSVPANEAVKAAAVGSLEDTVFDVTFTPEGEDAQTQHHEAGSTSGEAISEGTHPEGDSAEADADGISGL